MHVEGTTSSPLETGADTVLVGVFEGEDVAHDLPGEPLGKLLEAGEARREHKRLAVLHAEGRRFILVGLGARDRFEGERARVVAAVAEGRARELGARTACWEVPHHVGDAVVAGLVEGTLLHAYRFERYKRPDPAGRLERLIVSAHHDIAGVVSRAATLTSAQNRARDLGNTPPNDMTPADLDAYARGLAERLPALSVASLDEAAIRDAGMGAFAAVAQGSAADARLIQLDYDATASTAAPRLAFIGKGITFDSGGLWIKPGPSQIEMKFDMAGGAAVIEAVAALAELGAPVRVRGIVGATENLPSGTAVKSGDIVRALDGTTIEINNTDAEGRLVLADCIAYARREGCDQIVDLATLTIIDSVLGSTYAGVMSNDDELAARIVECGERTGELLWRLPLHEDFAEMVKGRYAQLTNRTERREAMPITAAELLHHFAGDTPWAHLDIAGTAYDVPRPYFVGKGATGFGVRLLVAFAESVGS
jgi:leucyl aminopeptidase